MLDSLSSLIVFFRKQGANRFYAKILAPNDNSKNQVYLGGNFSALNIIPHKEVIADGSALAGSKRDRAKAAVSFSWIDEDGCYEAPNTQLILYPKYPEVRMSGFLKGSKGAPREIMRARDDGRVLFLGITQTGEVLGHAAAPNHPLARELYKREDLHQTGVFLELAATPEEKSTRQQLLETLTTIYRKHWIQSQKLGPDGNSHPYRAQNGGGYTLEAELGISPNGYAEPDFLGWEIKQYGVRDFSKFQPKSPVTLLTPEPTGGLYCENGVAEFIRRFGYADKSGKADRFNFGGIYACNRDHHPETGLQLRMVGYDNNTSKITDITGGIALLDRKDEVAALWRYTDIIDHWNHKHAQAAYVPSLYRTPPPEYHYGPRILLCEQTDLTLFLRAVAEGVVYYDPGIKIENSSTPKPSIKRRSQFRIKHNQLTQMYHKSEVVVLSSS